MQVHQEGFVDGDKLLMEMKSAGDALASSVFSDLGGDDLLRLDVALGAGSPSKVSHGLSGDSVRVLPVFVFCLGDADGPFSEYTETASNDLRGSTTGAQERSPKRDVSARLFERSSPFKAEVGGDAVLVLQSESSAPAPFYERQEILQLPLTDATQAVVAGLLRSMHGTTAPDHWWSLEQQEPALDLSWAHGYHPFAPFGFGGSQPGELLANVARRNAVVSRAAAVASTLAETATVLEEFARAALPSELLAAGLWSELCTDGAAIKGDWGYLLQTAASSIGLPAYLAQPATDVHRLLYEAVGDFEGKLNMARGTGLMKLVAAMDRQKDAAMSIYGQVRSPGCLRRKRRRWRSSNPHSRPGAMEGCESQIQRSTVIEYHAPCHLSVKMWMQFKAMHLQVCFTACPHQRAGFIFYCDHVRRSIWMDPFHISQLRTKVRQLLSGLYLPCFVIPVHVFFACAGCECLQGTGVVSVHNCASQSSFSSSLGVVFCYLVGDICRSCTFGCCSAYSACELRWKLWGRAHCEVITLINRFSRRLSRMIILQAFVVPFFSA